MRSLLIILLPIFVLSCAQSQNSKKPVVLNKTLKEIKLTQKTIAKIKRNAIQHNYSISDIDLSAGIVKFEPHDFLVERGLLGIGWAARAKVNILAFDNSIQLTVRFECQYGSATGGNGYWAGCYKGNEEIKQQLLNKGNSLISNISHNLK